ncbi:MAG: hypothetical protein HLX50_16800 [Alteromonadaceae bacterium]|nr:hypothetical protein [Alteromonadaceae bacterium]
MQKWGKVDLRQRLRIFVWGLRILAAIWLGATLVFARDTEFFTSGYFLIIFVSICFSGSAIETAMRLKIDGALKMWSRLLLIVCVGSFAVAIGAVSLQHDVRLSSYALLVGTVFYLLLSASKSFSVKPPTGGA